MVQIKKNLGPICRGENLKYEIDFNLPNNIWNNPLCSILHLLIINSDFFDLVLKALKAMAKYNWYLSNLVAFIRLNLFVKVDLQKWLDKPFDEYPPTKEKVVQGGYFKK